MVAVTAITLGTADCSTASAAITRWGSDLSASAGSVQQTGGGVYANLALAGGQSTTAPASGQVLSVDVKGVAQQGSASSAPSVHLQTLRPNPDGSYTIVVTSQAFSLPSQGGPNQISTFTPVNLCVRAGDRLSLTVSAGSFQVFAHTPGDSTGLFTTQGPDHNGQHIALAPQPDLELLMRITEGTGADATALCPGGTQHKPPPKRHHRRHRKRHRRHGHRHRRHG